MEDRRELPRWQIDKEVKIRLNTDGLFKDCHIQDMNLKGMRMSLPEQLPQDHPVRMTLTLKDDFDFNVEVSVPWVREESGRYVHGLSFNIIMDADKDRIYQYVSRHCFKQFRDNWWSQ